MAKNFSVEVLISTAKATKDLQAAEGQVRALDRSLANLSKTLKDSNGNLEAAAKSIAGIVASSRAAATASKDLAQAKIAASKADAEVARNSSAAALSAVRLQREEAGLANTLQNTSRQMAQTANTTDLLARRQAAASASVDRMGNSLSNQRYLLYDVGATYRTIAIAAQLLPAASLAVATSYEKSFAQVIRTSGATGEAVGELRTELTRLGTEIPMSFAELADIAKIGGQLGIPTEALGKFTEVVATFVATADGVTIDAATESFGRLANLFAQGFNAQETSDFFERIGSAISYTADNSVTSEAKISASLQKIAPIAKAAGLSAVEVTALASALSSVGLPPEISRGFLTSFFGGINKAVATGSEKLNTYSKALGLTTNEFKTLYKNDPNAVLTGVVTQLSKLDKISQTQLLGDLGLAGKREIAVIQGLAQNLHVLEQAQTDTAKAFASGDYLKNSSKGIFNTFAANLQKLSTALANLGDSLGSSVLPILSPIVQGITSFAVGFNDLINAVPALKGVLGVLLSFGSIIGVWAALKSAQAFFTAGLIGIQHAAKSGAASTFSLAGQTRQLATTMLLARGATEAQANAMLKGATATQSLSIATTGVIGKTNALSASLSRASVTASGFGNAAKFVGTGLLSAVGGPVGIAVGALGLLATAWFTAGQQSKDSAAEVVAAFKMSSEAGAESLGKKFATETVGITQFGGQLQLVGKTYQEVAQIAGVSLADIKTALSGTSGDLDAYIKKTREARNALIESGDASPLDDQGRALDSLLTKLESYRGELSSDENAAKAATEANGGVATSLEDVGEAGDVAETSLSEYISKLGEAAAAAFGMVDAQGQVEASLEKLGAGIQKSTAFGTGSEDSRANLANLQSTLVAQATLFQQQVAANEITAENASKQYATFVQGLISELSAMGIDTSQFEETAMNAVSKVQEVFNGQVPEIPVEVQSPQTDVVTSALADLGSYLDANPLAAQMRLDGGDETAAQVYDVISYISSALGLPFEAVITALTNPAAEDSKAVIDYISNLTASEYTAVIDADTSAAIGNIRNFAVYAQNQIGSVISALGAATVNPILGAIGSAVTLINNSDVLATPTVNAAKANKALIPTFQGVKRGYNDAAKSAGGAGKAAKKAGGAGKKAGKDLAKAAKDAQKEWDEAEQAISGYASRIGSAFGYVFDRTQGVSVAKDEYYSVLNGIKERLEAQKQALKDLRQENKALNAERRVQLNDAKNLEEMAKLAESLGNTSKAKEYRDEAKALKDSAKESENKINVNKKEITTIEKGIGNLKGYTQAAIDNRAELRTLEQASLGIAVAYGKSGASAKVVREQTEIWTGKAKAHSKQLGYSKTDIEGVTTKTDAYVKALGKVPKTIATRVTETKTTTLKASNQTKSGVDAANKGIRSIPSSKNTGIKVGTSGVPQAKGAIDGASKPRRTTINVGWRFDKNPSQIPKDFKKVLNPWTYNKGGMVGKPQGFASGGLVPGTPPRDKREDNIMATLDGKGMAAIRSGEYIQTQEATDYYGSDMMDKINKMEIPRYALGGQIGKSNNNANQLGGVIDLSSETIQTLARMIEKDVYLFAGLEEIANSVNQGNQIIAQKGGHGVPK